MYNVKTLFSSLRRHLNEFCDLRICMLRFLKINKSEINFNHMLFISIIYFIPSYVRQQCQSIFVIFEITMFLGKFMTQIKTILVLVKS